MEDQLEKEIDILERKYAELYKPLDKSRAEIVNGLRDPQQEELAKIEEFKTKCETKEKPEINAERRDVENVSKLVWDTLSAGNNPPWLFILSVINNCEINAPVVPYRHYEENPYCRC